MKDSKNAVPKRVIGLVIGISVALIALVIFFFVRNMSDFDAGKYVTTILDYTFKGGTNNPEEMFDENSLTQLENQYETQITAFVDKSITGAVEMDEEMNKKYTVLCKDIFKAMKYKVQTVTKKDENSYKVEVEFQSSDVFQKYMTSTEIAYQQMQDKVNKGEYKGTPEEIELQMSKDILNNNYELLNAAYKEMQYSDKDSVVFSVKRDANEMFAMDSKELSGFVEKILGLATNQD